MLFKCLLNIILKMYKMHMAVYYENIIQTIVISHNNTFNIEYVM